MSETNFSEANQLREDFKAHIATSDQEQRRVWTQRTNELYEVNKDPDNWMTRYMLVLGIAEGKLEEGVSLLERVLFEDPSALIRHDAAAGLAEIQGIKAQPLLIKALGDESGIVRHESAEMLGWVGNSEAIEALKPLLKEPDDGWYVAGTARMAIEMIEMKHNGKDVA